MLRLRALLVLFAFLLPHASGAALASSLRHDPGVVVDWSRPLPRLLPVTVPGEQRALFRGRLFAMEIAILPSGRFVTRLVAGPYRPWPEPDPRIQPVVLPLPATLPLFLTAAAGLILLVGGGRRGGLRGAAGPPSLGRDHAAGQSP